jgi:hypothetical protein
MTYHAFGNGRERAFDSEDSSLEGVRLDGMSVVFDQKVGLHPANLQKATPAAKRPPQRIAGGMAWRGVRHGRR